MNTKASEEVYAQIDENRLLAERLGRISLQYDLSQECCLELQSSNVLREQKLVRANELVEVLRLEVAAVQSEKARFLEKAIAIMARRCISRRLWALTVATFWRWVVWSENSKAARALSGLASLSQALADCGQHARDMESAADMLLRIPIPEWSTRPALKQDDDAPSLGSPPPRQQQMLPLLRSRYQQTIFSEISWFDLYPKSMAPEISWKDAQSVICLLTEHCAEIKSIYRYYALHSLPKKDRRTFGVTGSQWLVCF